TAYVDISSAQQNGATASAWEELLAIYSMVNTLMQNFEEIKQVRFLLEGKEAQTLAGHIDLSRKFDKRMDLVKQ
ncbi:MAG TPA: GerMN domain-containing protein, partial [Nitrospirota bacterium]|nr:GerMN domain-containing protein [Nitrospirota bacterium]